MKKFFTLIAAALMSVCASAESSQAGVKLTYVDKDNPDVAIGEVAAGSTAQVGYNKISNGTVGFANTVWKVNYVGYIQVDAGGLITLLPKGLEIAERIYERHTFLTEWLISLGVSPAVAAEDACRIEHVISAESFAAIKAGTKKDR